MEVALRRRGRRPEKREEVDRRLREVYPGGLYAFLQHADAQRRPYATIANDIAMLTGVRIDLSTVPKWLAHYAGEREAEVTT